MLEEFEKENGRLPVSFEDLFVHYPPQGITTEEIKICLWPKYAIRLIGTMPENWNPSSETGAALCPYKFDWDPEGNYIVVERQILSQGAAWKYGLLRNGLRTVSIRQ